RQWLRSGASVALIVVISGNGSIGASRRAEWRKSTWVLIGSSPQCTNPRRLPRGNVRERGSEAWPCRLRPIPTKFRPHELPYAAGIRTKSGCGDEYIAGHRKGPRRPVKRGA